jgi:hypothetical protein
MFVCLDGEDEDARGSSFSGVRSVRPRSGDRDENTELGADRVKGFTPTLAFATCS